jgi:hypothetical protein
MRIFIGFLLIVIVAVIGCIIHLKICHKKESFTTNTTEQQEKINQIINYLNVLIKKIQSDSSKKLPSDVTIVSL